MPQPLEVYFKYALQVYFQYIWSMLKVYYTLVRALYMKIGTSFLDLQL